MTEEYTLLEGTVDGVGELSDEGVPEQQSDSDVLNLSEYDPTFPGHEGDSSAAINKGRCRLCKQAAPNAILLDGLCLNCAPKVLRELETGLVRFGSLKEQRKYCALPAHGTLPKPISEHPDWSGEIVVNGVHLYPVEPLCQDCLDNLTAWCIRFFEERGIMRKGSGHKENKFGVPYRTPLSTLDRELALKRLRDFLDAISIYTANKEDPTNQILQDIKRVRTLILEQDKKAQSKDLKKVSGAHQETSEST